MNFRNALEIMFFSLSFLLLISSANAITASLGNPKMILPVNITKNEPGIIEKRYIIVNNVNDFPVEITVMPDDVLKNLSAIIKGEDLNFTLQPNASKEIYFTLFATKPGFYEGKIFITYRGAPLGEKEQQVGLAANIGVNAKGEEFTGDIAKFMKRYGYEKKTEGEGVTPSPAGANPAIGIALIIAIVGLGVLTYYLFRKK